MSIAHFSIPTTILFGAGSRKLAGAHLRDRGFRRPLIVTDRALATLPVLAEFRTHLRTPGRDGGSVRAGCRPAALSPAVTGDAGKRRVHQLCA